MKTKQIIRTIRQSLRMSILLWLLGLTACQEQATDRAEQGRELILEEAVSFLRDFKSSGWRGCEQVFSQVIREEEMLDGTAGLGAWECKGVVENSYPYEFVLVQNPANEAQILWSQLAFRRGHSDSFYALLRYFLKIQGIEDAQLRFDIRSQVSSILMSNPKQSDFIPIIFLPDGRQLELAHNYPKTAYSTLRVKNLSEQI